MGTKGWKGWFRESKKNTWLGADGYGDWSKETLLASGQGRLICHQDIVEVEDWNEYGELKQHVKIVPLNPDGTIAPKKAAATKKTAAKAKVSATSVATKSGLNVDAVSSSTALPMRGIAEQAAQRAKDIKKQPVKAKSTAKADSQSVTMMQSPIDSTWSIAVEPFESETGSTKESFSTPTPQPSASGSTSTRRSLMFEPSKKEVQIEDVVESMGSLSSIQSPNSTAWKPLDMPTMGGFPSSFDVVRSGAASTNAQDPVTVHGNASLEEVSMEDLMAGDSSHETNKGIESVANPVDE